MHKIGSNECGLCVNTLFGELFSDPKHPHLVEITEKTMVVSQAFSSAKHTAVVCPPKFRSWNEDGEQHY